MNRIILSLALKNMTKNKAFSIINIVGLSLGIAAFALILFYVKSEKSYDSFHADKDKIYRVESQFRLNGQITQDIATASFGYAPAMKQEFPEIEALCRINHFNHEKDIRYNEIVNRDEHVFMVDSNFFTFFSYPLLQGNPNDVLNSPDKMVLSEKAAHVYFNNENPIGKIMQVKEMNSVRNYTVSGVFKELPAISNVKFDFLLAYDYNNDFLNNFWYMHETYLYVKVPDAVAVAHIEKAFPDMAEKYKVYDAMKDQRWEVKLIPITQIHLNPQKPYELEQKGNSRSLAFLFAMAILIMLIAWINFINLSTVSIIERRSDFAIMKAQGADPRHILLQLLANATLINLVALVVSIVLLLVSVPLLERSFPVFQVAGFWKSPMVILLIASAFVVGVVLTGIIPGLTLSLIKGGGLKKGASTSGVNLLLRKGLVITQYSLAVILLICTIMIRKQMNFMQAQELGANINNVLVFKTPTNAENYNQKVASLRDEMKRMSGVESVAMSSVVPGQQVGNMGSHKRADAPVGDDRLFEMLRIDSHFLPLYQIKLKEGRNFREDNQTDYQGVILNEQAVKWFGFRNSAEAIGKTVNLEGEGNRPYTILGILENYHQQSLKMSFTPLVFVMRGENYWFPLRYFSVRSTTANKEALVAESHNIFKRYFPDSSFEYFFTDQYFNMQYISDKRFSSFFMILSWISMFIVCIGLLGLSGFIMALRTKEIGVRKVNGAKVSQILVLLNKDFVVWVAIAFIIATPLAWYSMHKWLENFAYKTTLSWWIFALTGISALGIALLTVSWQSWRAATRNPVEALRYE